MTKKEWQNHYGFDEQDMEKITTILGEFNGEITKVSSVPRNSNGDPVAFIDRR